MNKLNQMEARLDRLERHNSMLRIILVLIASSVIVACAALAGSPREETATLLRTTLLQVVDADNNLIAELGQEGLLIRDDQQRVRVSLHHNDEDTGLYIQDEAGDSRVGIAHFAHGGSGVALHGPEVRGAAVLYYKNSGSLSFYDADGTVIERIPGR